MAASLQVEAMLRVQARILALPKTSWQKCQSLNYRCLSTKSPPGDLNDPKYAKLKEKPHPETPMTFHTDTLALEPVKGKINDKLPFRIKLEAGKTYNFCTCGYSKHQPFCDESHKAPNFTSSRPHHIRYRPLPFKVDKTKEYWLCMCKQSNNRPFCDGTHKREDVAEAKI